MKKTLIAAIIVIAGAITANGIFVTWPALRAKAADSRNENVSLYAHYGWGVNPTTLVLDLWDIFADCEHGGRRPGSPGYGRGLQKPLVLEG
ncbi:MAG: hypothetical protein E5X65_36335 [Mesorhizobium sp.]|nr:MAG: hypothetical protein E5X65_36335 [Mesorhizobium sp.]